MSGIGAAAATFLFRGCFQKQNLSGAVARLRGVAGKMRKSLGVPRKTGSVGNGIKGHGRCRWCRGTVGGSHRSGKWQS